MGVRRFTATTLVDTPIVTTAETVLATLTGVSTNQPGQTVGLSADYGITLGASTTAVTTRIRRDSLTGTLVGEATPEQISSAAGSTERHRVFFEESNPGEFIGRTYVLTVVQTAASANGNVTDASLVCEVSP